MYEKTLDLLFLYSRPRDALNTIGDSNDETARLLKGYSLLFMDNLSGAARIFREINSIDTLVGEAIISMKNLQFHEAIEKLERYLREGKNPYLKAEALFTLMQAQILTGNTKIIEDLHGQLLELSMTANLPSYQWMAEIHRARINILNGNMEGAISLLELARKGLEERKNIGRRILPLIQLAYYRAYMGNEEEAMKLLEEAASLASMTGSRLLQGLVHYYTYIVKNMLGIEDPDNYNMAHTLIELSGDRIMQTEILMDKIMRYIRNKELDAARQEITGLFPVLKETDYRYKIPTLMYFLAEVELLDRNFSKVLEIIDEYMKEHYPGRKFLTLEMMALKSAALLRMRKRSQAYREFLNMLRFTEEHGLYHYWTANLNDTLSKLKPLLKQHLKKADELEPYLLKIVLEGDLMGKGTLKVNLEAASRYLDVETVVNHLSTLKKLDPEFPEIYARLLKYRIQVLGGFSIRIGNMILREENFERPIHVKVMKYLILKRGLNLPKERIIEDIWRDKQTDKTHRTLNTILSNIRKILHPLGEKMITIKGTKGEVGFYPDKRFTIDAEEFEKYYREGSIAMIRDRERGKELLRKALELYTGDLLPADNQEWVEWERERLKRLYAQTALLLARMLQEEGRTFMAISLLEEAMYRTEDSSVYNALIELLEKAGLEERKEYWNDYVERFILSEDL